MFPNTGSSIIPFLTPALAATIHLFAVLFSPSYINHIHAFTTTFSIFFQSRYNTNTHLAWLPFRRSATNCVLTFSQGVPKRCGLSWQTNSALVFGWAQMRGGVGLSLSPWVQMCTWSPKKHWRSSSIFGLCFSLLNLPMALRTGLIKITYNVM